MLPGEGEESGINSHILQVLLAKYPKNLPSLYRTVLDRRPELDSGALAEALLQSQVPNKEKLALFLRGARHKDGHHRLQAFHALKELDRQQFTPLLLAAIDAFPLDVDGPYWTCPEGYMARLALASPDPVVWGKLEKAARRAAVGLRMELLNHFSDPRESRYRPERLRLLAAFLDDRTLRLQSSSPQFDGPCAGFFYARLEVRDFVALEISQLLGSEVETDLKRTPEQWAGLRVRVREALTRELDRTDARPEGKESRP